MEVSTTPQLEENDIDYHIDKLTEYFNTDRTDLYLDEAEIVSKQNYYNTMILYIPYCILYIG